ncbi:MAG: 4Fe-4S dicluster domain-containing protein [Clostridia bacterium]|nr:4Fe-4S dicluster domain-containing protein [Clostridia bacterium]
MKLNLRKGVNLDQHKELSFVRPLLRLSPPETVAVPILSLGQGGMLPIPRVGETVAKNSMLARSKDGMNWVVSPVSGKLTCIERIDHPLLGSVRCAYINVRDGIPALETKGHNPSTMTVAGVIQTARMACIIDEVDGVPLYYKLAEAAKAGIQLVIADCIDDTPYISSSLKTISEFGDEACDGVGLALKVLEGGKAILAIYDPGDVNIDVVASNFGFTDTARVTGGYPAWPRFEAEYCRDIPFVRIGVQALRALSQAVRRGTPQTETIITVSGDCVANPANIITQTGVTVEYILSQVGLKAKPRYVIMGDTMQGITCDRLDVPVLPGVRGICAMSSLPSPEISQGCISCGRCVGICPEHLFPSEAVRLYERGSLSQAARFGSDKCTGCGACSAVCPSGIEIRDIMLDLQAHTDSR